MGAPCIQKRARQIEEDGLFTRISMETYLAQAQIDRTCAAVVALAPAQCSNPWLSSPRSSLSTTFTRSTLPATVMGSRHLKTDEQ